MKSAYKVVDEKIRTAGGLTQTCGALFNKILFKFAKTKSARGSGFIFTLNQDLLVERKYGENEGNGHVVGISSLECPVMGSSVFQLRGEPLSDSNIRKIPNDFGEKKIQYENERKKNRAPLSYVKLHGSQEWITQDHNPIMVIGHRKIDRINAEPILKWYFELFIEQLKVPDTKLLIIGYGFNDKHVNEAVANTENLKIYIINPTPRKDILFRNVGRDKMNSLIHGYYQKTLLELFPKDDLMPESTDWRQIKEQFFDDPCSAV